MKVIITFDDEKGFSVEKEDDTSIFDAVGMMELAKIILLGRGMPDDEEDIDMEDMTDEEV
jgi:hypothetical protein